MNIYRETLKSNLPRLLNLYNTDSFSEKYGVGDREFWGWKTKDFINATFQGGVNSLAAALKLGLLENEEFVLGLIDSIIKSVSRFRAKNGSVVEAYPSEHSFCVTALVAYDILYSVDQLGAKLTDEKKENYLKIVEPLISFITKNDEEHAIISNHLATAVAAILLWNKLAKTSNNRADVLLEKILSNQSAEGWYREYEGADPGYQTLCTYYLASAYNVSQNRDLSNSLLRSGEFLRYFVHPDGSIGGLYGSRNTEVYYPGGVVMLAEENEVFRGIAEEAEEGYRRNVHILPQSIDAGNFVPLLNSYAFAARFYEQSNVSDAVNTEPKQYERKFDQAGLFVKSTPKYFAVINYKKGGTIKVFNKIDGQLDYEDGGITAVLKNGKKCSTQMFDDNNNFENGEIKAGFYYLNESYPTPASFIILRALGLTVFKSVRLGNLFKKLVVKLLMTGKKKASGKVRLKFNFAEDKITVDQKIEPPSAAIRCGRVGVHRAIHMASSGYYSSNREVDNANSKIVTINAD